MRLETSLHRRPSSRPNRYPKIFVHLIYSTKRRAPMLPQAPYLALHAYTQGILKKQKCHLIEMNKVVDHVHILFELYRTEALSNIVMHVK